MKTNRWLGLLAYCALLTSLAPAQSAEERAFHQDVSAAVTLYKAGQIKEATEAFERLYKQNERSSDVQAWLGFIYLRANKGPEAVTLLEKAAAQRPRDVEVVTNLGNAYFLVGKDDEALAKYTTAVQLNPKLFEPHYNTGNILLKKAKYAEAIASFETALKLQPNDAFVLNNLGVASERNKQLPQSASYFKRAADLKPENATFAANAGMALMRQRQAAAAVPYLERATKNGADSKLALALGEAYTQSGRNDLALPYYEGLREALSKNGTFWSNLGVLRGKAKNDKGAQEAYEKALEINPNDIDSINNLGLNAFKREQWEEARGLFDRLLGLNPSSTNARLNLAAACAKLRDWPKAVQLWKEHVRTHGDAIGVRLDLANALLETNDVAGARYHFLQVTAREADNAEALNGLGLIYLRDSKLAQAEAAFRSAIQSKKEFIAPYTNLAITLERSNRRKEAIEVLERALKIAPKDEDVRSTIERLKSG